MGDPHPHENEGAPLLPLAFLRMQRARVLRQAGTVPQRQVDAELRAQTELSGPLGRSGAIGPAPTDADGVGPSDSVGAADGNANPFQLPLWDDLPRSWRDDAPVATFAAIVVNAILAHGGTVPDGMIELTAGADWDRMVDADARAHHRDRAETGGSGGAAGDGALSMEGSLHGEVVRRWHELDLSPIPTTWGRPVNDVTNTGGTLEGTSDGSPVDPSAGADPNFGAAPDLDGNPDMDSSAASGDADARGPSNRESTPRNAHGIDRAITALRIRRDDPALLAPGPALVAAMLGRALQAHPDVAFDLVHAAPIVVVRVPTGVGHSTVETTIETCLPCWPLPAWSTVRPDASNRAYGATDGNASDLGSDRTGSTARPDDGLHDLPAFGRRNDDDWWEDIGERDTELAGNSLHLGGHRTRSMFGGGGPRYGISSGRSDDAHDAADDPLAGVPWLHRAYHRRIATIDATTEITKSGSSGFGRGLRSNPASQIATITSLQAKRSTVLIVAHPDTDLPRELVALADHEITLELPDAAAMALVIEAVAGTAIVEPNEGSVPGAAPPLRSLYERGDGHHSADDPAAATPPGIDTGTETNPGTAVMRPRFTFADACASLSPIRGAAGSLKKLAALVDARGVRSDDGMNAASETGPKLEDLAGYGKAKEEGLAIAADLCAYKKGELGWASVARGITLAGPPGTGKSFFARALARSAGVPLVIGSFADWQSEKEGHLGDMLRAMRECFDRARAQAPCVLFLDELDSVGDRRTFPDRHKTYSSQVVNGLLQHLDGAVSREGVVVCGATNLPGDIDPAVLRPGRLERVIHIDLPDVDDLIGMLRTHLGGVDVHMDGALEDRAEDGERAGGDVGGGNGPAPENDEGSDGNNDGPDDGERPAIDGATLPDTALRPIAMGLRGRTAAHVAACVQRARSTARRADRRLAIADLLAAADAERPTHHPPTLVHRASVHEAGHAIVALALDFGEVTHLSIDPDGATTGIRNRANDQTIEDIERELTLLMGGRAAEIAILGSPSGGAGVGPTSDLAKATRLATLRCTSFGLGSSLVYVGSLTDELSLHHAIAPVRANVERLLAEASDRALAIVREHREAVETIAERLAKDGYVEGKDVIAMWQSI